MKMELEFFPLRSSCAAAAITTKPLIDLLNSEITKALETHYSGYDLNT